MRFGVFNNFGAKNSKDVFQAFCHGLTTLGLPYASHDESADVAVIWSVVWAGKMSSNFKIWQDFVSTNRKVIVLEVGSLRRGQTWKVGVNGTGVGCYNIQKLDANRPNFLGLQNTIWKNNGTDILIACQRDDSQQWQGMPANDIWLSNTVKQIREHTDRVIVVRPHPRQKISQVDNCLLDIPVKILGTYDDFDLYRSFQQAWCVVNWNSGVGPQAVMHGIPVFVGPSSLAHPVGNEDFSQIESPNKPDRDQWLIELSHTEWTVDEISAGFPIKRILDIL